MSVLERHSKGDEVARLQALLMARLVASEGRAKQVEEDRLLDVKEAAERLSTTPDWLYRHTSELPFSVRLGPNQLRFSSAGISKFISGHQLRRR